MSEVITAVLNTTVGLLVNKARDLTAEKLKEGDLTDEQCRRLIVRELDDIKSKLDGLARKDLLSSVSFFEEGVNRLYLAIDTDSPNEETEQEVIENIHQADKATMMKAVDRDGMRGECSAFDEASPLPRFLQAIARLKITSEERFTAAKASFKSARERATDAFYNEALSAEGRIFAAKLRMISRILESLEDPDAAASDCRWYLEALHAMPAVQEIFSIHASGGIKSLLNKKTRLENVKSVTMINYILFHFIEKFTKTPCQGVFSWPGIDIGERSYYPLYEGSKILANMGVESPCHQLTCDVRAAGWVGHSIVNSKREIITASCKVRGNVNVINSQGEIKLFCSLPQEDKEARGFGIFSVAIDDEDNVYVVTSSEQADNVHSFKLFVFGTEGNLKHQFPLQFLSGKRGGVKITINMVKNIIIHKAEESLMHICNKDGQLQDSFPLEKIGTDKVYLSISEKNEIVAASRRGNTVYIYTKQGNLKRTIKLPKDHTVYGVAFNPITEKVIVYTMVGELDACYLLSYSPTDELQTLPLLLGTPAGLLTSHPRGPVALVHEEGVLYII